MRHIINAGSSIVFSTSLQEKLAGCDVINLQTASEALAAYQERGCEALVLNADMAGAEDVYKTVRGGSSDLPIILCGAGGSTIKQPVDARTHCLEEAQTVDVTRWLAGTLGLVALADAAGGAAVSAERVNVVAAEVWKRCKDTILGRVAAVERAATSQLSASLTELEREMAQEAALQVADTVGSFGFTTASNVAREMSIIFGAKRPLQPAEALRLSEWAKALRGELEGRPGTNVAAPRAVSQAPLMLIVDNDLILARLLARDASFHRLQVELAENLTDANEALARKRPDVVLLDLSVAELSQSLHWLDQLASTSPPVPVLTLGHLSFADRVEVARHGATVYFEKPVVTTQIWEAAERVLHGLTDMESKVLAVDDNPQLLSDLRTHLQGYGIKVVDVDDTRQFWERLEETSPDLLLLDVDMPYFNGLELCRVVRADPRWGRLPVLCLTKDAGAKRVTKIFEAGADDYLKKPLVAAEAVARVRSGLERTRLRRSMSDSDPLTGVYNRARCMQVVERLVRLAARNSHPLCIGMVNVDHMRDINARYRYNSGDAVLRFLGQHLLRFFRGEDVVGRWTGEQFILGLYGMSGEVGTRRIGEALNQFKAEHFQRPDGDVFEATFSCGVAEFPHDGGTLEALCAAAEEALTEAKAAGRGQVQRYRPHVEVPQVDLAG